MLVLNRLCYAALISIFFISIAEASPQPNQEIRANLAMSAFPEAKKTYYFDVPAANNILSNLMIRAAAGEAPWVQTLADLMEVGSHQPMYLVVGSANEGVARTAVSKALKRVKSERLDDLHLGLMGDVSSSEKLRKSVEATGAEFRVVPSVP